MRTADDAAALDASQAAAADTGVKAMIPIGRPFVDYLVSALADAGFTDVCLVIGPEHDAVRSHFAQAQPSRVRIHYAIQQSPRGTADAVLAAESFAGDESFVVILPCFKLPGQADSGEGRPPDHGHFHRRPQHRFRQPYLHP